MSQSNTSQLNPLVSRGSAEIEADIEYQGIAFGELSTLGQTVPLSFSHFQSHHWIASGTINASSGNTGNVTLILFSSTFTGGFATVSLANNQYLKMKDAILDKIVLSANSTSGNTATYILTLSTIPRDEIKKLHPEIYIEQ